MEVSALKKPEHATVELSLILPAYNAASFIIKNLDRVLSYLVKLGISHEVVVVDDGSTDATSREIVQHNAPLVSLYQIHKNSGKGAAVKLGMLQSRGEYRIFTDCDLPYKLDTIERMLTAMSDEGMDVCLGDRNLSESSLSTRIKRSRKCMSFLSHKLISLLLPTGGFDTQCGIKGFRKHAAEDIFSQVTVNGFAFDVEVICLARVLNYSVIRVPVIMEEEMRLESSISIATDGLTGLIDIIKIKRNSSKWQRATLERVQPDGPESGDAG